MGSEHMAARFKPALDPERNAILINTHQSGLCFGSLGAGYETVLVELLGQNADQFPCPGLEASPRVMLWGNLGLLRKGPADTRARDQ